MRNEVSSMAISSTSLALYCLSTLTCIPTVCMLSKEEVITSVLPLRKMRIMEIKGLVQNQSEDGWRSQGCLNPGPVFFLLYQVEALLSGASQMAQW